MNTKRLSTITRLSNFYIARAALEDEYSRKLLALCRRPLGSAESGTLRASMDVVRGEVETMAKAHQTIAAQMKSELEEPLSAFAGGMKERRKIIQVGIEKLLKVKVQQTQSVNKTRDRYEQDCLRIKGYLAQGHMVMGQEERKNKAKLEKTQIQLATTSNEYEAAVKSLEETTGRWNRDWKAACDKFQDIEEERLDFTKSSLWTFANIASTVCVSDDASCEKIRLSLENCEVEKDITGFIQERGTGQEIPDPPKYINFCKDNVTDAASEASDDDAYSVAQFQRTINPAFRTSSPQPSVYESHHDPQSELAKRMGHAQLDPSPSQKDDGSISPQKHPQSTPAPLNFRQQARPQGQLQQDLQHDFTQIPHNDYPTDGMTMFCRTDGASERSSAASPNRPSSRDSQSDYSNPTSFSSVEPISSQVSPTKQEPYSQPVSPNKQVLKKRSGFFSNSPFRRKSKHDKDDAPTARPTPSRNTWSTPNARGAITGNPSPTRPGIQSRDFAHGRSNSPEPVDPRASFQLNVGPNVFDVASPDVNRKAPGSAGGIQSQIGDLDPLAAALEELKTVAKQSSVRMSADRYHGIATPAPPNLGGAQNSAVAAGQRGTPPPSYHDQHSKAPKTLAAPQPAHTSKAMQETTRRFVGQGADMYGSSGRPGTRDSRPSTRDGNMPPRAASPLPVRSVSPRPGFGGDVGRPTQEQMQGPPPQSGCGRASPNPYARQQGMQCQGNSPVKQFPQQQGPPQQYSRHTSPNDMRRAASPQPGYARQDRSYERPASSSGMALQLSDGGGQAVPYGGSTRGRGGMGGGNARPVSYYAGAPPQQQQAPGSSRNRSKSVVGARQFSRDGRPIMLMARAQFDYHAAIPEELGFKKGEVLAVLRQQDDGWWEAEVTGKPGRPGLVPSNYLVPV
ncbi:hypothetical protein MMC25_003886 [Agyrium rufum]|nr:hypothetical protein [Agyrium rufum]